VAAQRADRLPIWRTVAEAFAVTARNSDYLFRISWMWVLVMLPIAFVYHLTAFRHGWVCTSHPCPSGSDAYPIGSTLLFMPMLSSIAVAWHRRLLANEVWQGRYYLRLDSSVAGYFGLALLVLVLAVGPAYVFMLRAEQAMSEDWLGRLVLVSLLAFIVGLFVSTRIWLALPAWALGRSELDLRQAWNASNRYFWRLLMGCLLCTMPVMIIAGAFAILAVDWTTAREPAVFAAWETMFDLLAAFLASMPIVSFLSLAYRCLIMSPVADAS